MAAPRCLLLLALLLALTSSSPGLASRPRDMDFRRVTPSPPAPFKHRLAATPPPFAYHQLQRYDAMYSLDSLAAAVPRNTSPFTATHYRAQGMEGRGMEARGMEGRDMVGRGMESRNMKGLGMEGRGMDGRGMENRGLGGRGIERLGMESRGMEGRGIEGRGMQDHGMDGRGMEGRGMDGRGMEGHPRSHQYAELPFPPGRSWTVAPLPDNPESSTKDPAIPDNPQGLEDPSLLTGLWEEEPTVRVTNAKFKGDNGSLVEAQAGTTAELPCVVVNRADHETVSWVRLRDHHLITVGRQTYSKDERFSVTYNRHLHVRTRQEEWRLHLRYAQDRDAGDYMCQLSTHPPISFISSLTITEASAMIAGGPEMIVQEGSVVRLECSLKRHTREPEFVFWFHNGTMINFETNRQVSVEKTRNGSVLTLAAVGRTDSGNYTCLPAKARGTSITLHIILGDAPAAMQVSGAPPRGHSLLVPLMALLSLHTLVLHKALDIRWSS